MVKQRAIDASWHNTVTITVNTRNYNLFDNYGLLTTQQIRTHVNTYAGTQTRDAQNAYQMAVALAASLTEGARTKVALLSHEYTVNGMVDGLLYFKALIKTATIDTRATTSTIRDKLSSLDRHMQTIDSDISRFVADVKTWEQSLLARGETTNDLLVNLFKGLKSASDLLFVSYIR